MASNFNKHHKKKDWKKIYIERVDDIIKKNETQEAVNEAEKGLDLTVATRFVQSMLDNGISSSLRLKGKEFCKNSIESIVPPRAHSSWKPSWGSQTLCSICDRPGISECTICSKCNIITHNSCIKFSASFEFKGRNNDREYTCINCNESIQSELDYYERLKQQVIDDRRKEMHCRKVAKHLVLMLERKKFEKKKRSVILLQSIIRRHLCWKRYTNWRRTQLRIVLLDLKHVPEFAIPNGVLSLTVFDTFKNTQSFRLDSTVDEALEQFLMIPGVSTNMTLLITLAKMEESFDGR